MKTRCTIVALLVILAAVAVVCADGPEPKPPPAKEVSHVVIVTNPVHRDVDDLIVPFERHMGNKKTLRIINASERSARIVVSRSVAGSNVDEEVQPGGYLDVKLKADAAGTHLYAISGDGFTSAPKPIIIIP